MQFLFILGLFVALIAVIFALQNPGIITIHFFIWEFHGSLALVLLLSFALGFLASLLVGGGSLLQKRWRENLQKKEVEQKPAQE